MSIDEKTVAKIAKLARLRLTDAEKTHYAKELTAILGWIEQLQEVDTKDVPITTGGSHMSLPMREDKVTDGNIKDDVLKNAPETAFDCFIVPKVIE